MNWLSPSKFVWEDAPLNTIGYPISAVCIYLVGVVLLEQMAMRKMFANAFILITRRVQQVHNLALSIASLIMVLSMTAVIYQKTYHPQMGELERDSQFLLCPETEGRGRGSIWYFVYIFYLSKYWELGDTLLQMIRGRRPPSYYFHIWHHTVYLLICFGYCHFRSSLAALAVVTNGSVHVVMYYYYYLVTCNRIPSWKRYITKIQIIQFLFGYYCFCRTAKLQYVDGKSCNGKNILVLHAAFNFTMLIGFFRILSRIKSAALLNANVQRAKLS